eukprot:363930-Chlamydomonas_euryale.AAC.7
MEPSQTPPVVCQTLCQTLPKSWVPLQARAFSRFRRAAPLRPPAATRLPVVPPSRLHYLALENAGV